MYLLTSALHRRIAEMFHVPAALLRGQNSWYKLNRGLDGQQNRPARFGKEKNPLALAGIESRHIDQTAHSPDAVSTELSQHPHQVPET
jgi:hypothetical protein